MPLPKALVQIETALYTFWIQITDYASNDNHYA